MIAAAEFIGIMVGSCLLVAGVYYVGLRVAGLWPGGRNSR